MSARTQLFIDFVLVLGAWAVLWAVLHPAFPDWVHFSGCFLVSLLASGMKVRLPKVIGTFSLNFCFVLLSIAHFSFSETVLLSLGSAVVQCVWNTTRRPTARQVMFNVSNLTFSAGVAYGFYHWVLGHGLQEFPLGALALVVCLYFVLHTSLVAGVVASLEQKPVFYLWQHWYLWSFPYYLVGSVLVSVLHTVVQQEQWRISLLFLPLLSMIYYYYRLIVQHLAHPTPA